VLSGARMKTTLALCTVLFVGCGTGMKEDATDDFSEFANLDEKSDKFTGALGVIGTIDYGQTKTSTAAAGKYVAWKFAGKKGDKVTVEMSSSNGDPVTWLLDNSFNIVGYNDDFGGSTNSKITATLPGNTNPSIVTYIIVARDYYRRGAKFTVKLTGPSSNFYACTQDSDCVKVQAGCCPHQGKVAVTKGQENAYKNALMCPNPTACIAIAPPPDNSHPVCNANNKCELVVTEGAECGGFSPRAHQCPAGFQCRGDALAWDGTGKCYKNCGGFGGFACSDGTLDNCVDDPNDDCDPNNGGADCGGFCHQCGDVAFRCTYGTDWLNCKCKDAPPANCTVTGCPAGRFCSYCWGSFQCIPNGALC
jgi:hypothetical protein